jgi:transcriptional regulator with XRE-family HTH domain
MSNTSLMIDALKRQLKAKAVTYAELARRIGLSEASAASRWHGWSRCWT